MSEVSSTGEEKLFWPEDVRQILARLESQGFSAHVVGGCVRDHLLNRPSHDYDIATSARPEEVARLFQGTVPTGAQHGTVTVVEFGVPVEVTTYRRDQGYSDGRHPDAVQFTDSLLTDLSRRDFTVNAIAATPDGRLVDPFHGLDDLNRRCIRAVGQAVDRFQEDALRILRGLRFCAELGFTLDPGTERAMAETSQGLQHISSERIGQEFRRLAAGNWPVVLRQLAEGPYLRNLPPPWPLLYAGFSRLRSDGWTEGLWQDARALFRSAWQSVEQAGHQDNRDRATATPDFILALTLFCTRSQIDSDQLRQICRSAAWGRRDTHSLCQSLHTVQDDPANWDRIRWRKTLFARDRMAVLSGCCCLDVVESVAAGHHTVTCTPRTDALQSLVRSQPLWVLTDLAVDGKDIMSLGVRGPMIGSLLSSLATAVLTERLPNEKRTLLIEATQLVRTQFRAEKE